MKKIDKVNQKKDKNGVEWINETGFYQLLVMGETPKTKIFQKWFCEEVLPSIARTGNYTDQRENRILRIDENTGKMILNFEV